MNWSTKRFIFSYYLFYSFLHVFRPNWYLQGIFDDFGWFLVYKVATLQKGFSVIDAEVTSLFLFFLLVFPFPRVCSVGRGVFFI